MPEESEQIDTESEDNRINGFSEAEQQLQETKNIFESGDYIQAIIKSTEAIEACANALSNFYGMGLSYAIRSSDNMINNAKDVGIDASSAIEIQEQARQISENKNYEMTERIIGQLKDAMTELHEQHTQRISQLINAAQSFIDEISVIGTNVNDADNILQKSRELLEADSLTDAVKKVRESESLAQIAYHDRVQGITDMLNKANDAIEEARFLNAPVIEAEKFLETARAAFNTENYISAIDNAKNAIKTANESRDAQIQRALSIQEKIKQTSVSVAPAPTPEPAPATAEPSEDEELQEELPSVEEEQTESTEEPVDETTTEEAAKICPSCSGELTYVDQYQKYFCYTCNAYKEPVGEEGEEEAPAEEEPTEETPKICPKCNGEISYVKQYKKYYCHSCSEYVEPAEKEMEDEADISAGEAAKECPTCHEEPTYVEQYKKYYCYKCNKYVEPVDKTDESATSTTSAKNCSTCGKEATFVTQYDRYYCYSCNKYM